MIRKSMTHFGIGLLYLLSLLPLPILYVLAKLLYFLLYRVFGYRKRVVRENLTNAFPEKSTPEILQIEKQYYRYLTNLMVEIIKMATMSKAAVKKRFTFKNIDLMEAYFKDGQSVLLCSAHYGNWEWGTLSLGLHISAANYPIYKPLSNPVFDNWFTRIRSRFGNHMISMRQTLRAVADTKSQPTVFCFGNDQAPQKGDFNFWTIFMNQPTAIIQGMEKIAMKTNRPIFYLRVKVLKKGYYESECIPLCMEPAKLDAAQITALHVGMLEQIIKSDPRYWLWSHRRWKHKPD
ncbi:lysophospholipid acyltransferase family protein [Pedobacter duraquae]|uniref:KDO2-lipid IV(A) lauroyltransferase n=1 Tax=Pedobacter duraquae TaxID=425511 RepID=A0A4R6IPX0_9SPHI|nr:lysophospholipid acyltransferase family protein [Pedobacter duraquae]TDO24323.1 KDO2-lipid IV(A) lauroyltransferase [Pedobacter duraquae]